MLMATVTESAGHGSHPGLHQPQGKGPDKHLQCSSLMLRPGTATGGSLETPWFRLQPPSPVTAWTPPGTAACPLNPKPWDSVRGGF